ncbi:MAG: sulfatase-like hydrolase/transferase, partial [Kiritimatiellia bacterium]|nr:sulfatase-like hydrolase/transferase [Kiritimatiellia bacterium]
VKMARAVDDGENDILQAVRQAGIEENTFIFFTTDHGVAFPFNKCTCYDSGIGVSLIFKFPRNRFAGTTVDALVSHLDVYPTLCELAGLEAPAWLEGHSILPLLEGKTTSIRKEVFAEVSYHAAYEPIRAIRTERYKLIRHFDEFEGPVLPNIDNGLTKALLLDRGLRTRKNEKLELFDLLQDPLEQKNLAGTPVGREQIPPLMTRLEGWMKQTADPLLAGPIPRPRGAIVNVKTGLHPEDKDFETD